MAGTGTLECNGLIAVETAGSAGRCGVEPPCMQAGFGTDDVLTGDNSLVDFPEHRVCDLREQCLTSLDRGFRLNPIRKLYRTNEPR